MQICIYDVSNYDIADIMKKNSWQMGCRPCTNKQLLPLSERVEQVVAPLQPSALSAGCFASRHILCPLWKRRHIVLQLTVCRSVGRFVDQVLSAHYLLTPSRNQYQTYYRGCPQWVDDPYRFSGHMFKDQGQTTLFSPLFSAQCAVCLISFDPFTWSITNLVQGLLWMSTWSLWIFRSHVQGSRSNHSS